MKFKAKFRIGQNVQHYCCGKVVWGTVVRLTDKGMRTKHKPVLWHNQWFTETNFYYNPVQASSGYSGITPKILKLNS